MSFLKMVSFFLNFASIAAALVFYLPLCTHNDNEGKPREARVRNIFLNLRNNTLFNEHPRTALRPSCKSSVSRCGRTYGQSGSAPENLLYLTYRNTYIMNVIKLFSYTYFFEPRDFAAFDRCHCYLAE